jgi:hypothetical protein
VPPLLKKNTENGMVDLIFVALKMQCSAGLRKVGVQKSMLLDE